MTSEQQQFEQMILALTSPDNAYRNHAEATFRRTKETNGMWLFQALLELAGTSPTKEAVQLSLIELRKIILHKDFNFKTFTPEAIQYVKQRELAIIGSATDPQIRGIAAVCISSTVKKLYADNMAWPELWTMLIQTMANQAAPSGVRAGCCAIFEDLDDDERVLAELSSQHRMLAGAFSKCISSNDPGLGTTATRALGGWLKVLGDDEAKRYDCCISPILNLLAGSLNSQNYVLAKDIAMYICDLVEVAPTAFRAHTTALLQGMMQVASADSVAPETRHMAVEVMLTYCESEPKTIRKVPGFAKALFDLLFTYLQRPEFEADWANTRDTTDEDDLESTTDFDMGATGIDRLATSLRAKHIQQIASQVILTNIHSQDWRLRLAATTAITYIIEACAAEYKPQLKSILDYILPLLRDENQYVRHAVTLCLAQCCTDFAPDYQHQHHAIVLPALVHCLNDVPRIQALACAAINTFFDEAGDPNENPEDKKLSEHFAQSYSQHLFPPIISLMNSTPHIFVKKEACETLGSIAEFLGVNAAPYVDLLVPEFQKLLMLDESQHQDHDEIVSLKSNAIQSVTLLAAAVKMNGFRKYATGVCDHLLSLLKQNFPATDPRAPYILRAWTCMAECMQAEIQPYLPIVIPRILEEAALNCDYEFVDEKPGEELPEAPPGCIVTRMMTPDKGEVVVCLKTSEVEEKSLALSVMRIMLQELQKTEVLLPYVEAIAKVAMDALNFRTSEEIRQSACYMLDEAMKTYKRHAPQATVDAVVAHMEPQLMQLIVDEPSVDVVIDLYRVLKQLLLLGSDGLLSAAQSEHSATVLLSIIEHSLKRRTEVMQERAKTEEEDEEVLESLEDEEEKEELLLQACVDAAGAYLKKAPEFVPHFIRLFLPPIQTLLSPSLTRDEQKCGLGLLCQFIGCGRPEVLPYLKDSAMSLFNYVTSEEPDLCQAAIYGLGETLVAARAAPSALDLPAFADHVHRVVAAFFSSKQAGNQEFECARTNMVSTSLKLLEIAPQQCNVPALWTSVTQYLPATGDEEEAQSMHEKLLRWIVEGHPIVSDPTLKSTLLTKLKAADKDCLNEATKEQLAKV